jgi:D-cysteine desulfhydrase
MVRTALQFQWRSLWQRDSYFLTAGGSSVLGCVAFVKAAFELAAQLEAGDMPLPDNIVCPAGSLSSCAGLTLGCALAGLSSQVIGVRVAPASVGPIEVCNENKIEQLMRETMHYLVQKGVIKPITLPKPLLLHDYYGEGYGHATAAGERALALFTEHGIALEQTYTAKAAAAALDICESAPDKTVLYWHTFNSVDLRERAQAVPDAAIPENLRRFL